MAKLLWALVLAAIPAFAQRVEGTVVDNITGAGIPGATVELVRSVTGDRRAKIAGAAEGKAAYSGASDTQGRFRIDDVADGFYTVRYRAAGYQDETWAPKLNPAPPEAFQVSAAAGNPVKLAGKMIHYGWISGRLVNDKGEAVPHAGLTLSSRHLALGSETDGDGKFRLPISPGIAYTLLALPQMAWKPPAPEEGSGRVMAWSRTYYPGVSRPEAAHKIVLPPGGQLLDVEMKLVASPAHAVRGVLLHPDGTAASKVAITLGQQARIPALRVESNEDGAFEFPAVADGGWRFSAEVERDGVAYRAAEWIEVAGRDVEAVKLRLAAPFAVPVRIVVETPEGWPAVKAPALRLSRVGRGPGPFMESPLPFRSEGEANPRFDPVYPGLYHLDSLLDTTPAGYYLDSVRLGDAVLSAPDVELSSGALPLIVTYKTGGGTLRGTVENCGMGGVVLAPQDPAMRWPPSFKTGRCDAKGQYEIPAVRPGSYYVQAFTPDRAAELWQPEFDENLVNQAAQATVRAGETATADLRVIR